MDKLILDFEGEQIEIPSGFAYERSFVKIGMKVEHKGEMYIVVDHHILGVDAVGHEFSTLVGDDTPMQNELTLVIRLKKA